MSVIAIASASDEEIRRAKAHAEARGFHLLVQEDVAFCSDGRALCDVILAGQSE